MSINKQVEFIEIVERTVLGLEGLQIVVYSDRCRLCDLNSIKDEKYNFKNIGNRMLKEIDGEYIKKKYNIPEGIEFKEKLHEERINWLKVNQ